MLNIYYGPESINKEEFIFDNIDPHSKSILIVPDQFSLQMEQDALNFYSKKYGMTALLNPMITDFSILGRKALDASGKNPPEMIDKYGRHMLLSVLIDKLAREGNLSVYSKMKGRNSFTAGMNQLISEMKRHDQSPEGLRKALPETDSFLRLKLADIEKIFTAYEDAIEDKFTDSEDYMRLYGEELKSSPLIKDAHIWIYGFDTFTPLHIDLISGILQNCKTLNIVMTWEPEDATPMTDARVLTIGGGESLFALTGHVIATLKATAQAVGSGVILKPVSSNIRNSIWYSSREQKDCPSGTTLVQASGIYAEADRVAAYISALVRDKGLRYRDIVVICNDMDTRGGVLKRTFDKWGIPSFADRKRKVLHQPVVRFLLSFLNIIASGYNGNHILEMISSGLMSWPAEDEELLLNYVNETGTKGAKWKAEFTWHDQSDFSIRYSDDDLTKLNNMRAAIVKLIEDAKTKIGKRNTVEEKITGLCNYLESDFAIKDKISQLINVQEQLELTEGAAETAQSWNMICGLFAQIINVIGEESISNLHLRDIIAAGLEEMEIGLVPASVDCVIIGTLQRTRISRTKALIVTAANEGILPMQISETGLLTSCELDKLENLKLSITRREEIREKEEQLAIYRMFSLPAENLLVTCSLADPEGKASVPSGIFTILKDSLNCKILGDLGSEDVIELIASRRGSLSYLADAMRSYLETGKIKEEWLATIKWFESNSAESVEKINEGMTFNNRAEALGKDLANALYFNDRDAINVSASRLETYSGCPFKYFVDKGLAAESPNKFELDGRSRGDVYHYALQELSAKHLQPAEGISITAPTSPWMTITRDDCQNRIKEILTAKSKSYREGIYDADNRNRLQLEKVIENCGDMAWAMISQVRKSKIRRMYFEEAFDSESHVLKPIEIPLNNGKKAVLRGRIDRIDVIDLPESSCIRIVDYKTGSDTVNMDFIEAGYKLQLMVYMTAALNGFNNVRDVRDLQDTQHEQILEPAGVFYFKINEVNTNADTDGTPEEKGISVVDRINSACRLEGIFVDDMNTIMAMDETISPGKTSTTIPVKYIKKDNTISAPGSSAMLPKKDFYELCEKTVENIRQICCDIQDGKIDIAPKREKNKDSNGEFKTACDYCNYKSICLFDTSFSQCRFENI